MDQSTIEKIESLVLSGARPLTTPFPAMLVPNGVSIKSLECFQPLRNRFRGSFETSVLSEFAAYVRANPKGAGFIADGDNLAARVFFNLGDAADPGHADWTATLNVKPTAAWHALMAIDGKRLSQRELAEWIEDWSDNVIALDSSEDLVPLTQAVAAIRNITISAKSEVGHAERDFGATRTALEDIEAKAAAGMPKLLTFDAEPALGFDNRTVRLRVAVITGEKPALTLRIVGKEALLEDMRREFRELVLREIGDAAVMTIGSFNPG